MFIVIAKAKERYGSMAAGSLFFSRNFSRDYEERLFSVKENGTRHGRGTLENEKQTADSSHVFEDIHTCQNNLSKRSLLAG